MAEERTLLLIKPDGVKRGLVGEILSRFENKNLKIIGLKMLRITDELADRHYAAHISKPFYPTLRKFITSGRTIAAVIEGDNVILLVRNLMGATRCEDAEAGTIRGDYACSTTQNLVHGSDSRETAEKEISLFFDNSEILAKTP